MRTTNRILSALLGLVLLVAGLAVAIETALIAWGGRPAVIPADRWYASLRELRFADRPFLVTSAVVALVGLVLLILQLRPWPPERVQTSAGDSPPLSITRRSVEHRVELAAARAGVPFAEVRAISNAVGPRDRQAWRIDDALTALRRVGGALATLRR